MRMFMMAAAAILAVTGNQAAESIEPEKPRFSIGAIADVQYADAPDGGKRLYRKSLAKLKAAVEDYNRQDLDFVVHLGDFIDKDWSSYDSVLPITKRLKHPWYFVLGNHEFAVADAHKAQVPSKLGMKARYYAFTRHGWRFIVTDGNDLSTYAWPEASARHRRSVEAHKQFYADKPTWNGGIGTVQIRWIDKELAEADARKMPVMLFSHFPLWPENEHNLWNAAAVRTMLERHPSVKIWLDGHNHDGNYAVRQKIHYVNLKAMLDTEETSYARLDFFPDRVELKGIGRQQNLRLDFDGSASPAKAD